MSRLPAEIREAVYSEDFDALNELLVQADQSDLNPAMFGAVLIYNNTDMLEVLLNAGANINYQDNHGRTALFLAVKYNRKAVVELLIQRGCDVQLATFNESNVLHLAARKGDPEIVQMLLDAGHEVNIQNWGGNTALLIASRFGNKAIVNKLLEYGSRLNACNTLGHTALHYACFEGCKDIVENLLSHGANPDARTHLGISPIMLACEYDHCRVVEILAEKCDLNKCEQLYGAPVLHWAVASGCLRCVKHLVTKGANIYSLDKSGRSPLLQAVQSDRAKVLTLLLSYYKASHFSAGNDDGIILHLASFLGREPCLKVLCEHEFTKCLLNQRDVFGDTPLDLAQRARQAKTVEFLQSHGAVSSKDLSDSSKPDNGCKANVAEAATSLSNINLKSSNGVGMCNINTEQDTAKNSDSSADKSLCNTKDNKTAIKKCNEIDVDANSTENPSMKNTGNNLTILNSNGTNTSILDNKTPSCETNDDAETVKSVSDTANNDDPHLKQLLSDDYQKVSLIPLFKTYSPVKMSMIGMLKSVSAEQIVSKSKFNFNTWLDNGPEAFVLKVVSLDITELLHTTMHNPWSLRELCRGKLRLALGYRANEKVEMLPVPKVVKNYLNMKELEEINAKEIKIRSTECYDNIEIE